MKKWIISIATLFLLLLGVGFFLRDNIIRSVLSGYLARQFESDVDIARARIDSKYNINIESLRIRKDGGWSLHAGSGTLKLYPLYFLKQGYRIKFELRDIIFLYSDIKMIHSILEPLSLGGVDELEFISASGDFSCMPGRFLLKSLYLDGALIRLNAHGGSMDSFIDYDIKLFLSRALVSKIPESVKKVFFREGGDWSNAELSVTGKDDNPAINFKTDLFTLSVR
jgi:hypothetical protein